MIRSKWPEFPLRSYGSEEIVKSKIYFAFSHARKHETNRGRNCWGWGRSEPTYLRRCKWGIRSLFRGIMIANREWTEESMWRTLLQLTRIKIKIMINEPCLVSESFCSCGMCYERCSTSMCSYHSKVGDWYLLLSSLVDGSWFLCRHTVSLISYLGWVSPSFAPSDWSRWLEGHCWKNIARRNKNKSILL